MLFEFFEQEGIVREGNPDFFVVEEDSLGIDTVRGLHEKLSYRSQTGKKKIAVLSLRTLRSEAANAFLKLAEEPPEDTHLFLLIESREKLLPTLQSRFFFVMGDAQQKSTIGKDFLALSTPARLEFVKKLLDAIKDEKKEKKEAVDLFDAVLREVGQKKTPENAATLKRILAMREFLETPGASLKMLLESLCLLA